MSAIISVSKLSKRFKPNVMALNGVDLEVRRGEVFALLGPNGAGKTTLINTICGITRPTEGVIYVAGYDILRDYQRARATIGLVPQELSVDVFQTVWDTVRFSRGLFGKPANSAYIEMLLRKLALWEKRNSFIATLSGGMKRRILIAKALAHEPRVLFLDEPTAGVDVELRHTMWEMIRGLREHDVTIVLTTHYLEEAEQIAERVGVIRDGEILLVEDKRVLIERFGKKRLRLQLQKPLRDVPYALASPELQLSADGYELIYTFDAQGKRTGIAGLLNRLSAHDIHLKDVETTTSSLEEIFVDLVRLAP